MVARNAEDARENRQTALFTKKKKKGERKRRNERGSRSSADKKRGVKGEEKKMDYPAARSPSGEPWWEKQGGGG